MFQMCLFIYNFFRNDNIEKFTKSMHILHYCESQYFQGFQSPLSENVNFTLHSERRFFALGMKSAKENIMLENTEERKIRIMNRAKSYAEGYISLQDFYESEKKENDDIRAIERKKVADMLEEARRERAQREASKSEPSGLRMSKEEFQSLPLIEQSRLYEEHPKEVRKLLGRDFGSKITKEQFNILTTKEQEALYRDRREEILALINGDVYSVDLEGAKE